jgi:hypothetical protein
MPQFDFFIGASLLNYFFFNFFLFFIFFMLFIVSSVFKILLLQNLNIFHLNFVNKDYFLTVQLKNIYFNWLLSTKSKII